MRAVAAGVGKGVVITARGREDMAPLYLTTPSPHRCCVRPTPGAESRRCLARALALLGPVLDGKRLELLKLANAPQSVLLRADEIIQ
jgi:hypothetical protein